MADVSKNLKNRIKSLGLGLLMTISAFWLIIFGRFDISQIIFGFSPYPFYILSLILGLERIIYAITGSSKVFKFLIGTGEIYVFSIYILTITFLGLGLYILIYTLFLRDFILILMDILNGIGYILFAYYLIKL
ncbi:MAG: hypothetical protein QXV69_03910 [Sulfolobaceae archaeon]